MDIKLVIFFAISLVTVLSALYVAFSKNLIRSAFSLLFVFAGVFGLYLLLSADFVAIVQLVIYIGGILILILFAAMLTTRIESKSGKKYLFNKKIEPLFALVGTAIFGGLLWKIITKDGFVVRMAERYLPTTSHIGNKLLGEYLLPFEAISVLLVLALVGAVVIARREVK